MPRDVRLYAHRGASAELPENTLPAFHRALELGADALETDAHLTRDGHVVLSHDPDGTRCCGVAQPIRHATLAEVTRWDAAHGFIDADGNRPLVGQGFRVPTLDRLLSEFPTTVFNIDVKQPAPSMVAPLLATVRRHRAEDRVILASFHLRTLAAIRVAGYRGITALSKAEILLGLLAPAAVVRRLPRRGRAAQVPLAAGPLRLDTRAMAERCHRLGVRLDFWTVNDPNVARRLLELGADGIMTDDPRAIAPVFAAFRQAS